MDGQGRHWWPWKVKDGDYNEKMFENGTVGYMSVFKFGIFTVLFLIAE